MSNVWGVFLLGYTYIRIIRLVIVYNHGNSVLVISTKFDFFREKGVTLSKLIHFILWTNKNNNRKKKVFFMKVLWQKPKWRVIITGILTIAISISLAVLDDWDTQQRFFDFKVVIFLLLSVVDIIYLIICTTFDIKENELICEMKRQMKAYESALSGIIRISQNNASNLNNCIHDYAITNKINDRAWSYKNVCYDLCKHIYLFVCELSGNKNCEVAYVRLNEDVHGEISMYAYANHDQLSPKLLNKKRNFLDESQVQYFDMKLYENNDNEIKVLYGCEAINVKFYRTPEERENNKNKYNQFIAIPVFCDDKKMVGLLEIACLENCSLGNNESEIKDIAHRYFVPYANLFLLLHKIEKTLYLGIN